MTHYNIILMYGIMAFMGWYGCSHTPKMMISKIGIKRKYYPQNYILPSRKFRKMFKLEKREMPKWIYFELCLSIVYIAYFLLFTLLYFIIDNKFGVVKVFMFIYMIFTIPNLIYIVVSSYRYR